VLSFGLPFLVLYFNQNTTILYYSFEKTWKGRTFYLFFLWLALLEIMSWGDRRQSTKLSKLRSARTVAFVIVLLLPTTYLMASNYYGIPSRAIIDWAWRSNILQVDWMPLHMEYLVLAALFLIMLWLQYGVAGLKQISISPVFLAVIGTVYLIDNVYRYGTFAPFQIFVPTTANLAATVLNSMGYNTLLQGTYQGMPRLIAWNASGSWGALIAWPCAGVDSLLIYTVTILLFLKKSAISVRMRVVYFVVGALCTYLINILRIVTIFTIGVNSGTSNAMVFHDYYGQLYSIIWIISYPLIVIGSQTLWQRIRKNMPLEQANPSEHAPCPSESQPFPQDLA
jgi:thaumarchaeosortase